MNYAQTFEEFSRGLGPTDLALYAGAGIIIWVLFKDKLSPIQKLVGEILNKFSKTKSRLLPSVAPVSKQDTFFKLVESWKLTRDLAVEAGCEEAVKVADQMFPYLSPSVCGSKEEVK